MDGPKILLPYNFTPFDQKALDFVIETFGSHPNAQVTLFKTYTPPPDLGVNSAPVMGKMKGNVAYLSQKLNELKEELGTVAGRLTDAGMASDQVRTLFRPKRKDVAVDIIDMAVEGRFNVVVLNHKSGSVTRFIKGKVYDKVVTALKGKTVCVVC
jgi:hypothetical protein